MSLKLALISFIAIILLSSGIFVKSALADTITISGHLQDSTGNSIAGATITVNDTNNDSATSDNSGNYSISVPSGTYNITVTPPSGSNFSPIIYLSQNISSNTVLNFIFAPAAVGYFSGSILDPQGNPMDNQEISLTPANGGSTTNTYTDANGNFSVQVSPGTYSDIEIHNGGGGGSSVLNVPSYGLNIINYSLTQSTNVNITLPMQSITVHVQDQSGNPVSGVGIVTSHTGSASFSLGSGITGTGGDDYGTPNEPQTDASGNATLWLFPNISYNFTAVPPNGSIYNSITLNNISVSGNQTQIVSLQYNHATPTTTSSLSPSQYSDGTYPDPTTVTLSATAAAGYSVANTYYTIDNGSTQTYSSPFTVTGSGNHTITYWSVDNSGVTEATNTKTFTISEAYTVSGTVYVDSNQNGFQDSGEQGYANATVTLNTGQSTTTDANGNYSFPNLESGSYTETLTLPNGYTATTTNPVSFALESNTTENFGIVQSLVSAINAGGSTAGNYVADTDYSGGSTYTTSASIDTSGVSNPAPEAVYQSVRYGNFSYTITNLSANGTYTVQLQFSEPFWGTSQAGGGGVGSRVFNVSVNGTQALSDFDVYAAAGGANKAVMEQIPATADSNGNITITFSTVVDNAMVSGIAVYNGTLPSPTPSPTPTPVSYEAISAGGQGSGNYVADTDYLGGTTYSSSASIDTSNVTNPAPQAVYQSVRYGNFSYSIPTYSPNTNYTVRLHFSEPYWQSAGSRLFNVSINGTQVLNNFDVYQTAGGENTAVAEQFNTTSDRNGLITIQFNSVVDNAMVSGIEITQQ